MASLATLFLPLVLSSAGPAVEGTPPSLAALLQRGAELEERGDYGGAEALYTDGARRFTRSATVRFRLGLLALRQGHWPEAIGHLQKAQALRPGHGETLYYLAQAYHLDGQRQLGLQAIRRAAALEPTRAEFAQKLGEYLCEANLCKQGLRSLLKARRMDPSLPELDFDLGMAYHKQAALPEARRHLEAALEQQPGHPLASRFLADVLGRQDQWRQAKDLYDSVAKREPDNAWALYGLGRAWVALGEHEAALGPLRRALEADPTLAEARFQLGQALRQLGRFEESERELALFKALRDRAGRSGAALTSHRTPFEERVWETCSRLLREDREAEALAYLDSLPRAGREPAHYLLGALYFSLERYGDSARLLAQAAARGPRDAHALALLGRAYVALGEHERAEQALSRARDLAAGDELTLLGTGELEYARGRWEEAIRHFEQSRTTQVPALLKLCRAYRLLGREAKALEAAELVRAFGKGDPASLRELEAILARDPLPSPGS